MISPAPGTGRRLAETLGMSIIGLESGHDLKSPCIACDSSDGLRIHQDSGVAYCYVCKRGWSPFDLAKTCLNDHDRARQVMSELGIFEPYMANGAKSKSPNGQSKIVATYDYCDATEQMVYQVVRAEPGRNGKSKDFWQRRPLPDGGWENSVKGITPLPYRLPELKRNPTATVFVVEGEKDVNCLLEHGLLATCNHGGAGKWGPEHAQHLAGHKAVVIIPDNDDPGRDHAQKVARSSVGVVPWIKVLEIPGLPLKGDVSDFFAAGGTKERLQELANAAPLWQPSAAESPSQQVAAIAPGIKVRARDRDNIGEVVADNGATCTVHFVSPDGNQATVELSKSDLLSIDGRPLDPVAVPRIEPTPLGQLVQDHPSLEEPIVDGLLRRIETGNFVAATKIGKTWLAYGLAFAVATGGVWLGTFQCRRGRVLLIDNELPQSVIAHRLPRVADAIGVSWGDCGIDVVSLRGRQLDLHAVAAMVESYPVGKYDLVILDAWYRCIPAGVSENDNAAIMALYNRLDAVTMAQRLAWVNVHHASKGGQGDKAVTDVGAGAGSQSRAADAHIVLRPHEQDGVVVMEAAVRSFKPLDPLAIQFKFPIWSLADADPSRLRSEKTKQREKEDQSGVYAIIDALRKSSEPLSTKKIKTEAGMGVDRCERLLYRLAKDGHITKETKRINGHDSALWSLVHDPQ